MHRSPTVAIPIELNNDILAIPSLRSRPKANKDRTVCGATMMRSFVVASPAPPSAVPGGADHFWANDSPCLNIFRRIALADIRPPVSGAERTCVSGCHGFSGGVAQRSQTIPPSQDKLRFYKRGFIGGFK